MIIPVKSQNQDLGLKTSMILQDFVCKITTDFGTITGEIMPDKSCMTFCDGLRKILQDLSARLCKKDFARFVRQDLRVP